jgi:hypothetical protein
MPGNGCGGLKPPINMDGGMPGGGGCGIIGGLCELCAIPSAVAQHLPQGNLWLYPPARITTYDGGRCDPKRSTLATAGMLRGGGDEGRCSCDRVGTFVMACSHWVAASLAACHRVKILAAVLVAAFAGFLDPEVHLPVSDPFGDPAATAGVRELGSRLQLRPALSDREGARLPNRRSVVSTPEEIRTGRPCEESPLGRLEYARAPETVRVQRCCRAPAGCRRQSPAVCPNLTARCDGTKNARAQMRGGDPFAPGWSAAPVLIVHVSRFAHATALRSRTHRLRLLAECERVFQWDEWIPDSGKGLDCLVFADARVWGFVPEHPERDVSYDTELNRLRRRYVRPIQLAAHPCHIG